MIPEQSNHSDPKTGDARVSRPSVEELSAQLDELERALPEAARVSRPSTPQRRSLVELTEELDRLSSPDDATSAEAAESAASDARIQRAGSIDVDLDDADVTAVEDDVDPPNEPVHEAPPPPNPAIAPLGAIPRAPAMPIGLSSDGDLPDLPDLALDTAFESPAVEPASNRSSRRPG